MMRRFIIRFFFFITIAVLSYLLFSFFVMPRVFEAFYGPNIERQIEKSFENAIQRNYDLLVLGNSRLYCGVNPDKFQIPAYNFAHNNDSFNQMYHKLEWLIKNEKEIKYIILGVDYFQFGIFSDSRNYVYNKYLGKDYERDYPPYRYLITYFRETLHPYKLRALLSDPVFKHDLKDNGQFVRVGVPSERDFIKRDPKWLEIQKRYFEKIVLKSKEHGIRVYLCMPPLRVEERNQYSDGDLKKFENYIRSSIGNTVTYLDFSSSSEFSMNDFVDFSHLDPEGANRFSLMLNEAIINDINSAQQAK